VIDGGQNVMKIVLKLYVSGMNPHLERSVANLRHMLDEEPGWEYDLSVCDVLEHPQVAEDNKILATPALVLVSPPPGRKVIGDLSETKKVLIHLGLPVQDAIQKDRQHGDGNDGITNGSKNLG
jgi:circadian clock protein KaiB